ncbi:MAG: glycosyltransferase family A protein [Pseudomonadota bacterium]
MSKPRPLVSVIVPARDASVYLTRAVSSALAQTYHRLEVIVVSDDSEDYRGQLRRAGLAEPRLRFASTPRPGSGLAHARNIGLSLARGCIIASLSATGVFYPTRLEQLVPRVLAHGAASDNVRIVENATHRVIGTARPLNCRHAVWSTLDYGSMAAPVSLVAHRALMADGWDERIGWLSELVTNMRVIERSDGVQMLMQPLHVMYATARPPGSRPDHVRRMAGDCWRCTELARHGALSCDDTTRDALIAILAQQLALYRFFADSDAPTFEDFLVRRGMLSHPRCQASDATTTPPPTPDVHRAA